MTRGRGRRRRPHRAVLIGNKVATAEEARAPADGSRERHVG
jgi:hypothetical protein